jgi:hypothetical protein
VVVTDDNDLWTTEDEPLPEDFEIPEDEVPLRTGTRLAKVLRLLGVLLLITALLLYFVVPFNNFFVGATYHWMRPDLKVRPIPAAPRPSTSPPLRV